MIIELLLAANVQIKQYLPFMYVCIFRNVTFGVYVMFSFYSLVQFIEYWYRSVVHLGGEQGEIAPGANF